MPAQFPGNAINKAAEPNGTGGYRSALAEAIQNILFQEDFDDQADYTIETAGGGGNTKDTATIPTGWDGVFNGTSWSPEKGDPDNHGSFEISALNARGGTGKAVTHYRQSHTQRLVVPDDGPVVLESTVTHIRLWMSTSKLYSTAKSATATVDGVDYTFTATTGTEGASFDDTTPGVDAASVVGTVDTSFASVTNQRPHRGIVSNAIEVASGATVSVTGGDIQKYDTFYGDWRARLDRFESDSQLIKAPIDPNNTAGTEELYVEFWIKFSEEWYHRGFYEGGWFGKIFRCAHWDSANNFFSGGGSDGALGPMLYWDYKADDFGLRNLLSFRGGPPAITVTEDNYKGTPVEANFGGGSGSWGSYDSSGIAGMEVGGTDPQLPDLVNGGLLAEHTGAVTHEMLFGLASKWTKIAFYVKMNSAPAAEDGIFSQYIDGHRIKHAANVPWVAANTENVMVKWNHFSLGGNDRFHPYPNADKYEDSYTLDDVVVRDHMPEVLI